MKALRKYLWQLMFCLIVLTGAVPSRSQDSYGRRYRTEVRQVPDSVVNRMKKQPDFRYANDSSYWEREAESKPGAFSKFLDTIARSKLLKALLYMLLAAGIIFTIYQVMIANNFFIISGKKKKKAAQHIGDEDLSSDDLDERIRQEINNKNYRQAVRYMYLKTLRVLSEYNFITLHGKSTNQDYIRQMYNHSGFVQFRQLTRIYEYVWYGEFDPTESQFEMIRSNFNQFNPRS